MLEEPQFDVVIVLVVNPTKQTLEDIEDFDPNNTTLFTDMVDSFSSKGLGVAGDATGEQTI